jgi:hypothetical protein
MVAIGTDASCDFSIADGFVDAAIAAGIEKDIVEPYLTK